MLIEQALARPFSRWDVDHGVGEPAHGYFARLVANEGHSSARVYANEIGANGRNIVPEEMLAQLMRLPLSEAVKTDLTRWTPVLRDGVYRIGDQVLRQKQLSYFRRRWCPGCLAESAHHRMWWDLVSYRTCPHHGQTLVDITSRGERIGWHWPHFDIGPDGGSLAMRADEVVADPLGWEAYLEQRLLGSPGVAFGGTPLSIIIDVCGVVGRFMSGDEAVGFATLLLDDEGLRQAFRNRIIETIPADIRRKGQHASIGRIIGHPLLQTEDLLTDRVKVILRQAFADVGRLGRKNYKGADIERSDFTLAEAAQELSVNKTGLSRFAKALGIGHTPWKDAHFFTVEDVEHLRQRRDDLITLPDTMPITGVPAHEFRFLETAGLITGHYGLLPHTKGVRYLRSDVVAIVARAMSFSLTEVEFGATLGSYAKTAGLEIGDVVVATLKGDLVPAGIGSREVGFRRLRFASGDVDASGRRTRDMGEGTALRDVAALTTLQQSTISRLVKLGVFEVVGKGPRLSEASVRRFHKAYVNATVLAPTLGCSPSWVSARLKAMGVPFAFDDFEGPRKNTIIARQTVAMIEVKITR